MVVSCGQRATVRASIVNFPGRFLPSSLVPRLSYILFGKRHGRVKLIVIKNFINFLAALNFHRGIGLSTNFYNTKI